MKSNKLTDYVKMNESDLQTEIKELKKELFKARFQHAMNGLDNPKKITEIKKNIARANTVKHQKSIESSK